MEPVEVQEGPWEQNGPRILTEGRRNRHKAPAAGVVQAEWGQMTVHQPHPAHLTQSVPCPNPRDSRSPARGGQLGDKGSESWEQENGVPRR